MPHDKKQPTHDVFVVTGEGETAYWTKVGGAWENKDGLGYNLQLSALPLDGRLTMRFIKTKEDEKPSQDNRSYAQQRGR